MPANSETLAERAARKLKEAQNQLDNLPRPGLRDIPAVRGITLGCTADGNLENRLDEITCRLIESGRVFCYGSDVVLEEGEGIDKRLRSLSIDGKVEPYAGDKLANIVVREYQLLNGEIKQSPLSPKIVSAVLTREPTLKQLPTIKTYANRPVFDDQFHLVDPGWHPDQGILVHGAAIPVQVAKVIDPDGKLPILERLPQRLRALLQDFCFASDADLVNALGVLLTGVAIRHFVEAGHPVILLDGNQPGVGKTLLARVIGMVLDGRDPQLINYSTTDEEVQKRLLATMLGSPQSCLIIDNAKQKAGQVVNSPVIEANSVAPEISLRILGKSQNYVRPNDKLWFLTMNDTKVSPDLVSRCIPIRFKHDGDPSKRKFERRDPICFARRYRLEILGELIGMVLGWSQQGQQLADRPHRLRHWAETIGGILKHNGFPEFLTNLEAAASEFNTELDDLAALAEQAIKSNRCYFCQGPEVDDDVTELIIRHGAAASKWNGIFTDAGLLESTRGDNRSLGRRISGFLSKYIDRSITVTYRDREVQAVLRRADGRSNAKPYCFQLLVNDERPEDEPGDEDRSPTPGRSLIAQDRRGRGWNKVRDQGRSSDGWADEHLVKSLCKQRGHLTKPSPNEVRKEPVVVATGNSEAWD